MNQQACSYINFLTTAIYSGKFFGESRLKNHGESCSNHRRRAEGQPMAVGGNTAPHKRMQGIDKQLLCLPAFPLWMKKGLRWLYLTVNACWIALFSLSKEVNTGDRVGGSHLVGPVPQWPGVEWTNQERDCQGASMRRSERDRGPIGCIA